MTTVLSQKGQIVLPVPIRKKLRLSAGDDFEVFLEEDSTISLRQVSRTPNFGLAELLLACPATFEVPPRERDSSTPLGL